MVHQSCGLYAFWCRQRLKPINRGGNWVGCLSRNDPKRLRSQDSCRIARGWWDFGPLDPTKFVLADLWGTHQTSIGQLFLAGLLTRIMFAVLFSTLTLFRSIAKPRDTPRAKERISFVRIILKAIGLWPFLLLIVSIMGSIAFGIATPTEAAGVGVIATIFIGLTWGTLTPRSLAESILDAVFLFAAIAFVVMGGTLLAQAVSLLAVPQTILKAGSIFWFRTTCRTCLSGRCVSCLGLFF